MEEITTNAGSGRAIFEGYDRMPIPLPTVLHQKLLLFYIFLEYLGPSLLDNNLY